MKRLSDNAIEIVNELHTERLAYESEYVPIIDALHCLAEYEDMEGQGLLVRLPCKVGIDAYFVDEATEEVCEAVVTNIALGYYTPSRVWLDVNYVSKLTGKQGYYDCADELIGKKLFFTREEAKKALEGNKESYL